MLGMNTPGTCVACRTPISASNPFEPLDRSTLRFGVRLALRLAETHQSRLKTETHRSATRADSPPYRCLARLHGHQLGSIEIWGVVNTSCEGPACRGVLRSHHSVAQLRLGPLAVEAMLAPLSGDFLTLWTRAFCCELIAAKAPTKALFMNLADMVPSAMADPTEGPPLWASYFRRSNLYKAQRLKWSCGWAKVKALQKKYIITNMKRCFHMFSQPSGNQNTVEEFKSELVNM